MAELIGDSLPQLWEGRAENSFDGANYSLLPTTMAIEANIGAEAGFR